jgi:tRNA (cmo5U34)-methyltransferase
MRDFARQIAKWKQGARLTNLSDEFEKLASGITGVPSVDEVLPDFKLFDTNADILQFYSTYRNYCGKFNLHFLTSIPYVLEEECRLGSALLRYLLKQNRLKKRTVTLQTMGNAEGVIARTITKLGNGGISTLTNSPTLANMHEFDAKCVENCFFHHGPFFEITKTKLKDSKTLKHFSKGFDVIYEDTTFQMYDTDREKQIAFAIQNLKNDGLFICLEKCLHEDVDEYQKREDQKDLVFKARYYSKSQLKEKEESIVKTMRQGQVTVFRLNNAIKGSLKHTKLIWNSCNFYIIAASNDLKKLEYLTELLGPSCIHSDFEYEDIPATL